MLEARCWKKNDRSNSLAQQRATRKHPAPKLGGWVTERDPIIIHHQPCDNGDPSGGFGSPYPTPINEDMRRAVMKNVKVKEARGLITPYPSLIGANAPAVQAAEAILRDPKTRAIHVVDRDQKLLGTVDIRMILKHFLPHMFDVDILGTEVLEILYEQKAKDLIADGPIFVTEEHDLESAMRILIANDLDEIPVVDEDKRVIGELNVLEILSVWLIKTQG